jgi:tetratricopeptide (TPR) repeat protein
MALVVVAVCLLVLPAGNLRAQATAPATSMASSQPSTQPTAADYALELALHNAINANYRLTYKQLDSTFAPDQTLDDLTAARDGAADALAKLLPASYGRQGVLQLFTPGTIGAEMPQWEQVHQLFSRPQHWFFNASTVAPYQFALDSPSGVVQVVVGEISSRAHREIKIGDHSYAVDIIRLNEGATGEAWSYLQKSPPVTEMLPPATVIVHVDRLNHSVANWRKIIARLALTDFATREANVRSYFGVNYKNAMLGICVVISMRDAQALPKQAMDSNVESQHVFEEVASLDATSDPDSIYAVSHSGASRLDCDRLAGQWVCLQTMGDTALPLTGLYAIAHGSEESQPAEGADPGPACRLTGWLLVPLSQKLAAIPSVAAAISESGATAPSTKSASVNYEALLQAWHASPSDFKALGSSLLDEEHARCLLISLDAGAKAGVVLDNARVDAIVAKAQKLSPGNAALQLEIGVLYYYQRRDALAEHALCVMDQLTTDPDLQSSRLEWLALIKLRAKDRESALDCLQLSAQLSPKDARHLYFDACELDKAGDTAKAIEMYTRFLAVEPSSTRATNVKKRIAELQLNPPPTSRPSGPGL